MSTFVDYVIGRKKNDKRFESEMRHAHLEKGIFNAYKNIDSFCNTEREIKIYALIGAMLVINKVKSNGYVKLGEAFRKAYETSTTGELRFKKLLKCKDSEEMCDYLRHMFPFFNSKGLRLDYADILNDLLYFTERRKIKWIRDFYQKGE